MFLKGSRIIRIIRRISSQQSLTVLAIATVALCEYYGGHEESGGHGVGYSYAKFSGPVSGPEYKIEVEDKHGHGHSYDFVAKPDYQFEYGVEDPKHYNSQQRKESRLGDDVHGEYSVTQPDGKVRHVKYTADKHNGFNAEVTIDGKPLHYDALQEQQAHLAEQQAYLAEQQKHISNEVLHEEPAYHHSGPSEESYGGHEGYSGAVESGESEYY